MLGYVRVCSCDLVGTGWRFVAVLFVCDSVRTVAIGPGFLLVPVWFFGVLSERLFLWPGQAGGSTASQACMDQTPKQAHVQGLACISTNADKV